MNPFQITSLGFAGLIAASSCQSTQSTSTIPIEKLFAQVTMQFES